MNRYPESGLKIEPHMYEPEESEEESYSVADSGSSDRKVNDTAGKY